MRRRKSRIALRLTTISMSRPMRPSCRTATSDSGASTVSASSHFEPALEDCPTGAHWRDSTCLLADHAVPVPVSHLAVRRVRPGDWCAPVPARLLARDPAVAVVVVAGEHVVTDFRAPPGVPS